MGYGLMRSMAHGVVVDPSCVTHGAWHAACRRALYESAALAEGHGSLLADADSTAGRGRWPQVERGGGAGVVNCEGRTLEPPTDVNQQSEPIQ